MRILSKLKCCTLFQHVKCNFAPYFKNQSATTQIYLKPLFENTWMTFFKSFFEIRIKKEYLLESRNIVNKKFDCEDKTRNIN